MAVHIHHPSKKRVAEVFFWLAIAFLGIHLLFSIFALALSLVSAGTESLKSLKTRHEKEGARAWGVLSVILLIPAAVYAGIALSEEPKHDEDDPAVKKSREVIISVAVILAVHYLVSILTILKHPSGGGAKIAYILSVLSITTIGTLLLHEYHSHHHKA